MKKAASMEMLQGQDRGRSGSGEKPVFRLAEHAGREKKSVLGKGLVGCYLPTGGEMGQSSTPCLWCLAGRHVCFLAFLQPADNSPHNAAVQIGWRRFEGIADPDTSSTVCGRGWGKRGKNSMKCWSFKAQACEFYRRK